MLPTTSLPAPFLPTSHDLALLLLDTQKGGEHHLEAHLESYHPAASERQPRARLPVISNRLRCRVGSQEHSAIVSV